MAFRSRVWGAGKLLVLVGALVATYVLFAAAANPERLAGMDRTAVAITTIAVVVGWLAAEIRVFSKLRIPVFDPPEDTPR
mgnify:CR=1 FL=1